MHITVRPFRSFLAAGAVLLICTQGGALDARQAPAGAPQVAPAGATGFFPVPPNIKAEGLPPIPASIPDAVAPYGQFRQAILLGWHPTKRAMLIATAFGNTPQIHSVAGPGMDRRQLTFHKDPISTAGVFYAPDGSHFVFRSAPSGGDMTQFFRYDVATGKSVMITDGKQRYGVPAWSNKSGVIAFDSNRRNGRDQDVFVMNPLDPSSMKTVLQGEGRGIHVRPSVARQIRDEGTRVESDHARSSRSVSRSTENSTLPRSARRRSSLSSIRSFTARRWSRARRRSGSFSSAKPGVRASASRAASARLAPRRVGVAGRARTTGLRAGGLRAG